MTEGNKKDEKNENQHPLVRHSSELNSSADITAQRVDNSLEKVTIGGKFVGGNDYSTTQIGIFGQEGLNAAQHLIFVEQFSMNAATHIAKVAQTIADGINTETPDFGLEDQKLLEKFKNMKCSATYKSGFDEHAALFPTINNIRETDAIPGGSLTIQAIISSIRSLYLQLLDQWDSGDKIHNAIFVSICKNNFSAEEQYATHALIFYVINECGIFNEKK